VPSLPPGIPRPPKTERIRPVKAVAVGICP
jgi:hypothetical protein